MDKLYQAIENTLAYAGFFHYPLTVGELTHFLISARIYSEDNIVQSLRSKRLKTRYKQWLVKDLPPVRKRRQKISQKKMQTARLVAQKLSWLPTIKLIAVTGSLAVQNATTKGDIDLMIITRANTLWLTRPLVILLTSLMFKRRTPGKTEDQDAVCLNLWVDTRALAVPPDSRNVYTAHEILQLVPIYEQANTYQRFLRANAWVRHYMANAYAAKQVAGKTPREVKLPKVKVVHWWSVLNKFFYRVQYWYMRSKMTREVVNLHAAYFHPKDWASDIQKQLDLSGF